MITEYDIFFYCEDFNNKRTENRLDTKELRQLANWLYDNAPSLNIYDINNDSVGIIAQYYLIAARFKGYKNIKSETYSDGKVFEILSSDEVFSEENVVNTTRHSSAILEYSPSSEDKITKILCLTEEYSANNLCNYHRIVSDCLYEYCGMRIGDIEKCLIDGLVVRTKDCQAFTQIWYDTIKHNERFTVEQGKLKERIEDFILLYNFRIPMHSDYLTIKSEGELNRAKLNKDSHEYIKLTTMPEYHNEWICRII